MEGPWKIALYGTDTYHSLDANGEVALSDLDLSIDPLDADWPIGDTDWTILDIIGASPEYEENSEVIEAPGGYEVENCTQRLVLKAEIVSVVFPDDMSLFVTYKNLKKKRYIYLLNINYPDSAMPLHASGKAVAVNIKKTVDHDYDNGVKVMTLEIRKIVVE